MGWWIALNSALYMAAIILFFAGLGWASLICLVLAILLTLFLTGGGSAGGNAFDALSDIFMFLD